MEHLTRIQHHRIRIRIRIAQCAEHPEQILSIRHDYSGQDLLGRAADWNAVVLPRHLRYNLGGCALIHGNKAIAFYFALYSTVRRA
ncbi:MAG: hypothetical protein ACQETY_11930 [Pseudomonadota bacterium]